MLAKPTVALTQVLLLLCALLVSNGAKAELLGSLYSVFGAAGKSACNVAANGLALLPIPTCSSNDTLQSPADLFCRFTQTDCNNAYLLGEQTVNSIEQQASDALQGCITDGTACSWQLLSIFGEGGRTACLETAGLAPGLPPTIAQCQSLYASYDESVTCLQTDGAALCLNELFVGQCVAAADYFPHSAAQCDALSNLVEQGINTIEQCLEKIMDCPEDLMQQLRSGVVRLQGQVLDTDQLPLVGVMIAAVPVSNNPLEVTTSTHVAVTDTVGSWQIEINPAFSFTGDYRVNAVGAFHDFTAIYNTPYIDYVVTVE